MHGDRIWMTLSGLLIILLAIIVMLPNTSNTAETPRFKIIEVQGSSLNPYSLQLIDKKTLKTYQLYDLQQDSKYLGLGIKVDNSFQLLEPPKKEEELKN